MMKSRRLGNARTASAIALPIFIFFSMAVVCGVFAPQASSQGGGDIPANVRVAPTARLECLPDPFVINDPKAKVVTCYVELTNYDTGKIIPSTLRLSLLEKPVTPMTVSKGSPNTTGDFDHDGYADMKITFDKKAVDGWFGGLSDPTLYNFRLTGEILGIPDFTFITTDLVNFIKPSYIHIDFYGKGGGLTAIKGVDLSTARIQSSSLESDNNQLIKMTRNLKIRNWGNIAGTVAGKLPVEMLPGRTSYLNFKVWVDYKTGTCKFVPYTSMACDGDGTMYKMGVPVGYGWENVKVHFESDGVTATLTAKEGNVVVFEQKDVPMKYFRWNVETKPYYLFVD